MMGRENRYYSYKKAKRARRIDTSRGKVFAEYPWYNNLHQYSKNKIFCSCPLCRANYWRKNSRKRKWRISDLRKLDKLDYEEMEVEEKW